MINAISDLKLFGGNTSSPASFAFIFSAILTYFNWLNGWKHGCWHTQYGLSSQAPPPPLLRHQEVKAWRLLYQRSVHYHRDSMDGCWPFLWVHCSRILSLWFLYYTIVHEYSKASIFYFNIFRLTDMGMLYGDGGLWTAVLLGFPTFLYSQSIIDIVCAVGTSMSR